MTREEVARAWFEQEFVPVVDLLREEDLIGRGTETEAYARVVSLRYLLLRTHAWDDEIFATPARGARRTPATRDQDTLIHELLREMR